MRVILNYSFKTQLCWNVGCLMRCLNKKFSYQICSALKCIETLLSILFPTTLHFVLYQKSKFCSRERRAACLLFATQVMQWKGVLVKRLRLTCSPARPAASEQCLSIASRRTNAWSVGGISRWEHIRGYWYFMRSMLQLADACSQALTNASVVISSCSEAW